MDGPLDPPMSVSRKAPTWRIRQRGWFGVWGRLGLCVCVCGGVGVGDQLSHPDAANLLHASHVNGNATVCLERHLFCTSTAKEINQLKLSLDQV